MSLTEEMQEEIPSMAAPEPTPKAIEPAPKKKPVLDQAKLSSLKAAIQKDPAAANQALHEISNTLGFTREVQDLARANMMATVATIQKGTKLSSI